MSKTFDTPLEQIECDQTGEHPWLKVRTSAVKRRKNQSNHPRINHAAFREL